MQTFAWVWYDYVKLFSSKTLTGHLQSTWRKLIYVMIIKVFLASTSIIQMSHVFTFFPVSGKPTLFKKPHLIFLAKFEKIYFTANKKIKKYNALDFWQAMFHNGCTKEQLSDIMSFLK